ncbi:hypothetical protein EWM64_g2784 [Hericium alpestre]|uniref:Uncharacterized protein n=1 Tax=Hericium alpestre TaxID=135208 RepID=A0A4Z0A5N1_9AGAM|nr:hypothetical protein EWM64_g2784 [Hericium alpestre]
MNYAAGQATATAIFPPTLSNSKGEGLNAAGIDDRNIKVCVFLAISLPEGARSADH